MPFFSGRSGRFETFEHVFSGQKGRQFAVTDCVSLYPSQSRQLYPEGKYEIITDLNFLNTVVFDPQKKEHYLGKSKMIGLASVSILTPADTKIPLFGIKLKDKYVYGNCAACIKKRNRKPCRHGPKNRSIIGTLCWNELNYAVSLGYIITQIFECYQYKSEFPLFENFFYLLSQEKIRYSVPDLKQQSMQDFIDQINNGMNYPDNILLKPEDITPHTIKRNHCKQDLNMIFGKLSQHNMRNMPIVIKSQSELESVDFQAIEDVFALDKACLLVSKNKSKSTKHNRRANSIIYSYVLAYSRIHMYKTMFQLESKSANIYQIANDCLYFSHPADQSCFDILDIGPCFGQFRDEFPNKTIYYFVSFGSKSCALKMSDSEGHETQIVKARGFSLKTITSERIIRNFDFKNAFNQALNGKRTAIKVPHLRKRKNVSQMSVEQVLMMFQFSNHIAETRVIFCDGTSAPYGYYKEIN